MPQSLTSDWQYYALSGLGMLWDVAPDNPALRTGLLYIAPTGLFLSDWFIEHSQRYSFPKLIGIYGIENIAPFQGLEYCGTLPQITGSSMALVSLGLIDVTKDQHN